MHYKYYLVVRHNNNDKYIIGSGSLKDLANYTMAYSELEFLSMVPKDYYDGELVLLAYSKDDVLQKELPVPFINDHKFFDPGYLANYMISQINNTVYMDAFLDKYYLKLRDIPVFSSIIDINNCFRLYLKTGEYDININNQINDFVRSYCYSKNKKTNKYELNFSKLYDLAMFNAKYNRNQKNKNKNDEKTINKFEILIKQNQLQIDHYYSLIQNNPTDEEKELYEKEIDKLKSENELLSTKLEIITIRKGL